jgi:O-antigen/teichoic acid export membrane protein
LSNGKSITRNISIIFFGNLVSSLLGLIYFAYAARYFGAKDFGILSFAIAITSLLAILIDFGTNLLIIREVARDKSKISKMIGNSFIIKIAFGLLAFGILTAYLRILSYNENIVIISYIMLISILICSIKGVFDSLYQALEKPVYLSIGNIANILLLLSGLYIAMLYRLNIIQFSYIYLFINLILLIYFAFSIRKYTKISYDFDPTYLKYMLKESWPFAITYAFVSIYVWTDSIMLSIFKGEIEVGYYNVAYRLVLALLIIPVGFNIAVYPILSRNYLVKNSRNLMNSIISKYFIIMLLLVFPIAIGTSLLADRIIFLIFGAEYFPSVIILQILIWSLVFTFMNAPFVKLFESINMQVLVMKITGISALINVVLNYFLIPKYSVIGASIATLITEAIVSIALMYIGLKLGYFNVNNMIKSKIIKIIVGCLTMGFILVYLKSLNLIALILLCIFVYVALLYLLNFFERDDILLFKSIFKKGDNNVKS